MIVYLNVYFCVSTLFCLFVIARLEPYLFCDGISAPDKYSYYYYYWSNIFLNYVFPVAKMVSGVLLVPAAGERDT